MAKPSEKAQRSFKDYYLILQIHPEADYAMVDAAYWHLARRYNQAALADPTARARLDDLNEAYSVLGSPLRREEYNSLRIRLISTGALPATPAPAGPPLPLAVMERQKPRPREHTPVPQKDSRSWTRLSFWQLLACAAVMLTLAIATFGTWAPPPLVGGLLGAGILAVSLQPLWRLLGLSRRAGLPRRRKAKVPPPHFDPAEGAATLVALRTPADPDPAHPLATPPAPPPPGTFPRGG